MKYFRFFSTAASFLYFNNLTLINIIIRQLSKVEKYKSLIHKENSFALIIEKILILKMKIFFMSYLLSNVTKILSFLYFFCSRWLFSTNYKDIGILSGILGFGLSLLEKIIYEF